MMSYDPHQHVTCSAYFLRAERPVATSRMTIEQKSPARNPFLHRKTQNPQSNDLLSDVTDAFLFLWVGRSCK
jgi:hypothetical protein